MAKVYVEKRSILDILVDFWARHGIRVSRKYKNINEAINYAIDYCLENGILTEVLRENRSEVQIPLFTFDHIYVILCKSLFNTSTR